MQEMQKNPAVLAHRPRYVEQRHHWRRPRFRPDETQIDKIAAAFKARSQRAADVDEMSVRMRRKAPGAHLRQRQDQALDGTFGGDNLRLGHLRKVFSLQHLAVRDGHPGVELDFLLFLELVVETRKKRFLNAR